MTHERWAANLQGMFPRRYAYHPALGEQPVFGFFLTDWIEGAGDVLSSVADRIPGGSWIRGNVNDAVKKLAGSKDGQFVLTVISTALVSGGFTALAPVVGPQAASAAFAIPGVIAGDSFSQAWVDGFTFRLAKLADTYGAQASQGLSDQTNAASKKLEELGISPDALARLKTAAGTGDAAQALAWANMTPEQLAARFGGRVDAWAAAMNGRTHEDAYPLDDYDLRTGASPDPRLGYLGGMNVEAPPHDGPLHSIRSLRQDDGPVGVTVGLAPATQKTLRDLKLVGALLAPTILTILILKLPKKARA